MDQVFLLTKYKIVTLWLKNEKKIKISTKNEKNEVPCKKVKKKTKKTKEEWTRSRQPVNFLSKAYNVSVRKFHRNYVS